MEKTKLGVSVGIFGAFLYVAALFGGYIAITLLADMCFSWNPMNGLRRPQ